MPAYCEVCFVIKGHEHISQCQHIWKEYPKWNQRTPDLSKSPTTSPQLTLWQESGSEN